MINYLNYMFTPKPKPEPVDDDAETVHISQNKFGNLHDPKTNFVFVPGIEDTVVFGKQDPETGKFVFELTKEDRAAIEFNGWGLNEDYTELPKDYTELPKDYTELPKDSIWNEKSHVTGEGDTDNTDGGNTDVDSNNE